MHPMKEIGQYLSLLSRIPRALIGNRKLSYEEANDRIRQEWDLCDRYTCILDEEGQYCIPTRWQVFLKDWPESCPRIILNTKINSKNNGELPIRVWTPSPLGKSDIWIEFLTLNGRLGLAPRGNPTVPNSPENLELLSAILEAIRKNRV